ncbi:MAG TPA: UvrD-helicase domain-containing protein [Acidobacteriota bacterium]|nr:UvrD-helicase domain-containing protein [Acidobacteriota bacterium]
MRFIGDFHIHSHFSRATSKQLIPEFIHYWAAIKGISVVGTGDFTHPGWLKELKEKLEPSEEGLFKLKKEYTKELSIPRAPDICSEIRFILSTEISSIYKKNNKVRKVHNVILAPDFSAVEKIQKRLLKIGGNITSDGRPILGLDSRDLLEMVLEASDKAYFIPAHVWTPWFSVLGSKSGFDSIEECFEDLTPSISAVETGLSTDAPMHWMCSFLDKYTLISNSDAHSPEKLGRNANIFNTELTYPDVIQAMKTGDPEKFLGTIDLFPQEGKYHYDGHRKCGVRWDPVQTLQNNGICPECGKKVTVGVTNRVAELSDRKNLDERPNKLPFYSIIPLKEILSEIKGVGPSSKTVDSEYFSLIRKFGPELSILLDLPAKALKKGGFETLSEAIKRMRNRQVIIQEGFDGEYGRIKVFHEQESLHSESQEALFDKKTPASSVIPKRKIINFDLEKYRRLQKKRPPAPSQLAFRVQENKLNKPERVAVFEQLNREQKKAVFHKKGPAMVIAGPGTGKTHTLCCRTAYIIQEMGIPCEKIIAVTFTNKAAQEIRERLKKMLPHKSKLSRLNVATFHAFGYEILKKHCKHFGRSERYSILSEEERLSFIQDTFGFNRQKAREAAKIIKEAKQNLQSLKKENKKSPQSIFTPYEEKIKKSDLFDIDDCLYRPLMLFSQIPSLLNQYKNKFSHMLVDEFQDINFAQYQMIITLMPEKEADIYIIGDPDQAIYGFRGADVRFMKDFLKDYPNASVYKLKQSYRCSDFILRASGGMIRDQETEPSLLKGLNSGVKINIASNTTHKSEAEFVARQIEEIIGGVRFFSMDSDISKGDEKEDIKSFSDFAVLCRTKEQMKSIEKALNDHTIPSQKIGETPFFKEEPIKSVIDVFRLSLNQENFFLKQNLIKKKIIKPETISALPELTKNKPVAESIHLIITRFFQKQKEQWGDSFKKLLDIAKDFKSNSDEYVKYTSLCSGSDTYDSSLERVTLMTLHAAKGLEFPCVFITGCEEGLLPYSLFVDRQSDLKEERRLLYVGMTRAIKYLYLTYAKKRFIQGQYIEPKRSRFLDAIEEELINNINSKSLHKKVSQMKLF